MDDTSKLDTWEVQALVSHLMYRISQDNRQRLARELPAIYNKLCNSDVVVVQYVCDLEPQD